LKIVFADSGPSSYDGSSLLNHCLGGTESSIIYLAEELAKRNHEVYVLNGTVDAVIFRNVKYLPRETFYYNEQWWKSFYPDIVISLTAPFFTDLWKNFCPDSKIIVWTHLFSGQPATQEIGVAEKIKDIDMVVGVSDWHCEDLKKNYNLEKVTYIKNAISDNFKNLFNSADDLRNHKKNLQACYTSAPYRGLEILAHSIPLYRKKIDFDIFSSMKLYQMDDDAEFENVYLYCQSFSGVKYHGVVPQKTLAQELKSSTFFTYPCTMEETFCLSQLEAMAAGCKSIVSDMGALKSTSFGYANVVPCLEIGKEFMIEFTNAVLQEIVNYENDPILWSEKQFDQVKHINEYETWEHRANDWEKLFIEVKSS
jgi:glycosyltransferase involved in cell wall biosynthesis